MSGRLTPLLVLVPLFLGVLWVFWKSDLRNRFGSSEDAVPIGSSVDLFVSTNGLERQIVHFHQQGCVFAEKNIGHLRILHEKYQSEGWEWCLVVDSNSDRAQLRETLGFEAKILTESDDIARLLGVSIAPQMVIIQEGKIFFRGNYTKNGAFCGADNILSSDPGIALRAASKRQELPIYLSRQASFVGCPL